MILPLFFFPNSSLSARKLALYMPFSKRIYATIVSKNPSMYAMTKTLFPTALPHFLLHVCSFCAITRVTITRYCASCDGFIHPSAQLCTISALVMQVQKCQQIIDPLSIKQYTARKKL
jgi:hypothetical protein